VLHTKWQLTAGSVITYLKTVKINVKVKVTLEQATKAKRGIRRRVKEECREYVQSVVEEELRKNVESTSNM
jgi:hypothetical protein